MTWTSKIRPHAGKCCSAKLDASAVCAQVSITAINGPRQDPPGRNRQKGQTGPQWPEKRSSFSRPKPLSLRLKLAHHLSEHAFAPCDIPPKYRVWEIFSLSSRTRPANRRQPSQPRWKIRPVPTKTVSGIPYWPARDPIGEAGGDNLYGFVGNDGIGFWDMLGMQDCSASNAGEMRGNYWIGNVDLTRTRLLTDLTDLKDKPVHGMWDFLDPLFDPNAKIKGIRVMNLEFEVEGSVDIGIQCQRCTCTTPSGGWKWWEMKPQTQDPRHRRGGGRGKSQLCPQIAPVRRRTDHRQHRQERQNRPDGNPDLSRRRPGHDLSNNNCHRHRRGTAKPLPHPGRAEPFRNHGDVGDFGKLVCREHLQECVRQVLSRGTGTHEKPR